MADDELTSAGAPVPAAAPVPGPGPVANPRPALKPQRVVAIGASAGGLEALQQLFTALPGSTGMAFVVVQHLSPDFKSLMPELLGRQTHLPVLTLDRDLPLSPDTVYVLSAGHAVELDGDLLRAIPRPHEATHNLPINRLFASLAVLGPQAAAVVLSGTGQDGMVGAKAVKEAGGLVIAQVPSSARFDSMPRAVIDNGVADIIAMPGEIGRALLAWLRNPVDGRRFTSESTDGDSMMTGPYAPVLHVLQRTFDLDFSHYKSGTVMRRIDRWLNADGRPVTPATLAAHLEANPGEIDRLFADLMIGVTSFFRDPEVFDTVGAKGLTPMIEALGEREQLRLWCCACSTGEEAYSLAILALEAFDRLGLPPRLRVLATDVHAASVQRAAAGVYPPESLDGLSETLRERYFTLQPNGHFKVCEALRRYVVFSVQNVLKDPGFQRIDLVSCRNMLIYLRPSAQAQVLASFHISLSAGGLLLLGKSEMPSEHAEAYLAVDESAHLFRKRPGLQLPLQARPLFGNPGAQRPAKGLSLDNRASYRLQEVLAQRYVPSGFLVNQNDELVYLFGNAGRYLQAAPGRFGGTMFNLLSGPLRTAVTMSIRKAAQSMTSASMDEVIADEDNPAERVRIDVDPIADRTLPHHYFMVRVTPMVQDEAMLGAEPPMPMDTASAQHIADLEGELLRTREALQRSIEDLEAANEELQAGNEELMAANEELQSSNEELHALNEELYSVNSEHEQKIQELRDTSADLSNLIRATELAIIFLDLEARLRLFTPPATSLFPLRSEDIGRELRDLLPREGDPTLFDDIARTLVGGDSEDHEMTLRDGRIVRRRVTPYRTDLGVTSGLVITYVDVSQQVRLREQQLALRHQAQLKALVGSVPHLMWTCDADGLCDFLSPKWVEYTGLSEASQLGHAWLEQVHPEDQAGLMAAWNGSVRTGQPFHTQFRIRRHDGAWRWFDTHGIPQLDEDGRIVKWFGSNTDIDELRSMQQALHERDDFVQMVADNINGMVGYWDQSQRNRFANQHYLDWFGRTAEQVRGHTLQEVLGDAVYAANRPYIEAALRGEPQSFERTITRPDGSIGHLLAQYTPHVVQGQVQGFIATATDITAVQEARLLADQVFLVSPVPKLIFDADGRIARWNPAAEHLLGYPADQIKGLPLDQLVPAPLRARHALLRKGYVADPVHRPMGQGRTFPLVRGDGSQVDVEIELSGVRLDGRQAVIACVREASISPHAQKKLDLALQARSQFLAQISHEIRTPLNAILGMSQLLEQEQPTPKQLDRLRRIEEASNLLLDIVNDVLDLSSLEAGRLRLEREPFDVHELLDRSLAIVAEKARVKHLALELDVEPSQRLVLTGDARRIEQILVNLLANAVKFTNEGSVHVRAQCSPAASDRCRLRVEVQDTGIGIAPAMLDQLFRPFQQLHEGHGRRFGGTGLGLSICRQLARAMGGDCGVESAPGVGSTFWFTVLLEHDHSLDDVPSTPVPLTSLKQLPRYPDKRVLVVEDNVVNRIVIKELLSSSLGIQVSEAEDGEAALALAQQQVFDLVLMDVQMPGIDGLETTRRMRQLRGYAEVPIYALSANVRTEDIHDCLAAGMNDHLGKPIMLETLAASLISLWGPRQPV